MSLQAFSTLQAFQSPALWLTLATLRAMFVLGGQMPAASIFLTASCMQIMWLRFLHHLQLRSYRQPLFWVCWLVVFAVLAHKQLFVPWPPDPTLAQRVAWIWLRGVQAVAIPAMSYPLSLRQQPDA